MALGNGQDDTVEAMGLRSFRRLTTALLFDQTMMTLPKSVAACLLAMLLVACAGTNFSFDRARRVQVGMSEADVKKLLGRPYMVTSTPDSQLWTWSYANGITGAHKTLVIPMKDGKVASVPNLPNDFH